MRADGIWHPRIVEHITRAGHGDLIAIVDAGMPIPAGVEVIDLIWARNEPGFVPVLLAVVGECVIESATVAVEMRDALDVERALAHLAVARIPHESLQALTAQVKVAIRTGEATPFRNVVLSCGVAF